MRSITTSYKDKVFGYMVIIYKLSDGRMVNWFYYSILSKISLKASAYLQRASNPLYSDHFLIPSVE